ncbi:unnamed protein product [Chilo suppressalis]|uniref:PDZ domain-containing protein n=1 Tax=Chilo suppressalis TaxID=168631 RepID=A0ABN8B648_CHISP|nr:unnamed protein product [Chilo suppressalis]
MAEICDNPVYVQSVKEHGAAWRAGLRAGDRILRVDAVPVHRHTHQQVVQMIRASPATVLTVQQNTSRHKTPITAPVPVNPEKQRQLEVSKVYTMRLMLEQEQKYIRDLRNELCKVPDVRKQTQLESAELRCSKLQHEIDALAASQPSPRARNDKPNSGFLSGLPRSLSNLTGHSLRNLRQNRPRAPDPAPNPAPLLRHNSDEGKRRHNNTVPMVPTTCLDNVSNISPPPLPPRAANPRPFPMHRSLPPTRDNPPELRGTPPELGYDPAALRRSSHSLDGELDAPGPQPNSIAMQMNYPLVNAPPPPIQVMRCACANLLLILTDAYRNAAGVSNATLRRWAYEIQSTFLIPSAIYLDQKQRFPLEYEKEELLRNVFRKARQKAKEELSQQLSEFQVKRQVGSDRGGEASLSTTKKPFPLFPLGSGSGGEASLSTTKRHGGGRLDVGRRVLHLAGGARRAAGGAGGLRTGATLSVSMSLHSWRRDAGRWTLDAGRWTSVGGCCTSLEAHGALLAALAACALALHCRSVCHCTHGGGTLDAGRWTLDVGRRVLHLAGGARRAAGGAGGLRTGATLSVSMSLHSWRRDAGRWTLDAGRWTSVGGCCTSLEAHGALLAALAACALALHCRSVCHCTHGGGTLDAGRWTLDAGRR